MIAYKGSYCNANGTYFAFFMILHQSFSLEKLIGRRHNVFCIIDNCSFSNQVVLDYGYHRNL